MRSFIDAQGAARSAQPREGGGGGGAGQDVARNAEHLEVLLGQLELASASRRSHHRGAEHRRPVAPGADELCRGDIVPCAIA